MAQPPGRPALAVTGLGQAEELDQRVERGVGLLDHHHVTAAGQHDRAGALDRFGEPRALARRRHPVELAGQDQGPAAHLGGRGGAILIGVQAARSVCSTGPAERHEQAHRVAHHPAAGRLVAAEMAGGPEAPVADQLGGARPRPAGGRQQIRMDRHRGRRAEQRQPPRSAGDGAPRPRG